MDMQENMYICMYMYWFCFFGESLFHPVVSKTPKPAVWSSLISPHIYVLYFTWISLEITLQPMKARFVLANYSDLIFESKTNQAEIMRTQIPFLVRWHWLTPIVSLWDLDYCKNQVFSIKPNTNSLLKTSTEETGQKVSKSKVQFTKSAGDGYFV